MMSAGGATNKCLNAEKSYQPLQAVSVCHRYSVIRVNPGPLSIDQSSIAQCPCPAMLLKDILFLIKQSTLQWFQWFVPCIQNYRLINNIDTKVKCRRLKNLTSKESLGKVFIDWRYSQSCCYFRLSFVNCCPYNLLYGSTQPPSPLPCVNKYTVYTYTVCKRGGGMGFWASER
jgi:hypothetical protein